MKYFRGIIASYFLKDKNGSNVFFPWGIFGKGYLIEDVSCEKKIRSVLRTFLFLSFPIICISTTGVIYGFYYIITLPLFFITIYSIKFSVLVKGLPVSERELRFTQALRTSAAAHDLFTLRALFIGAVLFALFFWVRLFIKEDGKITSIIGGTFFTIGAFNALYMIKHKK